MNRPLAFIKNNGTALTMIILSAITILSLWPQEQLPLVPGSDKTHHIIAYTALMLPAALSKPGKWVIFGLLFFACSGAIELLQPYVNRCSEWLDLAANATGIACGLIIAKITIAKIDPSKR